MFLFFFAFLSYTAADNAGDYDSYGHRCCWTAAAGLVLLLLPPGPKQAGRDCSAVCVVLVLVAVRFASWTMMAELCFSVDDCILFVFSNTAADTAR